MRKKFCQLLGKLANFFLVTAAAPPCQARRSPEMGKKIFAPSLGKAGAFSHRGRTPRPGSPFTGGGKENLCPFPWESWCLFSPRAHPQAGLAVYRRRERKPLPLTLGEPAPFLTAGAPHAGLAVYRRRERKPLPLPLGKLVPFLTAGAPPGRARRLPEAGKKTFAPHLGGAGAFSHRGRTPRPGSPLTGGSRL